MNKIFLAFLVWFFYYGLSFLASGLFHVDQRIAFFIIYFLTVLVAVFSSKYSKKKLLLATIAIVSLYIAATFVGTILFNFDFFVVFQIVTFGQCLTAINND